MVVKVRNNDVTQRVDCGIVRSGKLVKLGATGSKFGDKLAGGLQNVDTGCLVVHNDELPCVCYSYSFGPKQSSSTHLADELSPRLMYRHPLVVIVRNSNPSIT